MEAEKRAAEVLRQTEANLRELASAAARAGEYADVVKIAVWAKAVGEIAREASTKDARVASGVEAPGAPKGLSHTPTKAANQRKPRRGAKAGYPRFFRQGDKLVRIAWSKRDKKEYRHTAPYTVLLALVNVIAELGKDGRIFSTEDFLPICESDGAEVPAYQAYVGIAFLKHTSLIDQHGRQGYSIPRLAEFKDAVEALWQKLPNR
jgi:hypothetical protein